MLDRPPYTPSASALPNESAISLAPPLLEASIVVEHEEVVDERTGLLRSTEHVKIVKERRKASSIWILPATFFFAIFLGAGATVEVEIVSQIACRILAVNEPILEPPSPALSRMGSLFLALPGNPAGDWVLRCRASSEVQKTSTELVTSVALVGGILSAATSAYWGKVSDRFGRKKVLTVSSVGELLTSIIMVLVVAFPQLFGFKTLLAGSILGGIAGGTLTGMAASSAYLGDCAVDGSKTELLSKLFGVHMFGMGVGPLLGSFLIRDFAQGVLYIYLGQILLRTIHLCVVLPLMPESLVPSLRTHSRPGSLFGGNGDDSSELKRDPLLVRLAKMPVQLIEPFKALLPKTKTVGTSTSRKKDYRLVLIAISYTLAMVVPGMMAVKVLFARGKFGWGPEATGEWITYLAAVRVVLLVVIVPFIVKYLRKAPPQPLEPRPEVNPDNIESAQAALRWEAEAAKLKKAADTGFDLSTARWCTVLTIIGYLVTSIPASTSHNFLLGSAMTAPGALLLPSLQSLALAIAAPDDSGKVLACFSALATFTASTIGPSLFGAIYVFSLDWWPELVFVVGAVWTFLSLIPLLFVKYHTAQTQGNSFSPSSRNTSTSRDLHASSPFSTIAYSHGHHSSHDHHKHEHHEKEKYPKEAAEWSETDESATTVGGSDSEGEATDSRHHGKSIDQVRIKKEKEEHKRHGIHHDGKKKSKRSSGEDVDASDRSTNSGDESVGTTGSDDSDTEEEEKRKNDKSRHRKKKHRLTKGCLGFLKQKGIMGVKRTTFWMGVGIGILGLIVAGVLVANVI
ncbi:hypothetical protein JCM3765_003100 [Sporobolomyces pararoseus]